MIKVSFALRITGVGIGRFGPLRCILVNCQEFLSFYWMQPCARVEVVGLKDHFVGFTAHRSSYIQMNTTLIKCEKLNIGLIICCKMINCTYGARELNRASLT